MVSSETAVDQGMAVCFLGIRTCRVSVQLTPYKSSLELLPSFSCVISFINAVVCAGEAATMRVIRQDEAAARTMVV